MTMIRVFKTIAFLLSDCAHPLSRAFGDDWEVSIYYYVEEEEPMCKIVIHLPWTFAGDIEKALASFYEGWWAKTFQRYLPLKAFFNCEIAMPTEEEVEEGGYW